jgi:hypothetical protein
MSKIKTPIRNLTALDKEIYRLQLDAIKLENKLGDNFKYFKNRFPELIIGSISQRFASRSLWSYMLELFLENEHIRSKMGKGMEWLAEKSTSWFKKKFA